MTCPRGVCHYNPNDPDAPEYLKYYKIENNCRPFESDGKCTQEIREPRIVTQKKTRQDFLNT